MHLIINADDFGSSASVNEAVYLAHTRGVLTSASWMPTGQAAGEAVALARGMPTLAVGLHLVLVKGQPALPPREIPHLVDPAGRFPDDPLAAGLRWTWSAETRAELARELEAQFELFAATGLALDHVDSHLHFHVHPAVFPRVAELARRYGACGLRLPRDDLSLAWRGRPGQLAPKIFFTLIFTLLNRLNLPAAQRNRLFVAGRVFGLLNSGRMEEAYVIKVLERVKQEDAEMYFHPACRPESDPQGPNPGDLATLLSETVRQTIRQRGIHLTTYTALAKDSHAA